MQGGFYHHKMKQNACWQVAQQNYLSLLLKKNCKSKHDSIQFMGQVLDWSARAAKSSSCRNMLWFLQRSPTSSPCGYFGRAIQTSFYFFSCISINRIHVPTPNAALIPRCHCCYHCYISSQWWYEYLAQFHVCHVIPSFHLVSSNSISIIDFLCFSLSNQIELFFIFVDKIKPPSSRTRSSVCG